MPREFDRPVFSRLRQFCLALPETRETAVWGHPNFRAGKRTFCAFELIGGRPSIAFRVTAAEAKQLARKRHFFSTPYGRGVWVSRWLETEPVAVSGFKFHVSRFSTGPPSGGLFSSRLSTKRFRIPPCRGVIMPTLSPNTREGWGNPGTGQRLFFYLVLPKTCFNS